MLTRAFLLLLLTSPALAAPPAVTTLTPSGGQRGTSVAVTVTGTFDKWPVTVWSSSPGVAAKAEKDKGKFTLTVAADAPLGVAWLRFHDDTGASQLRPFVVGGLTEVNETEPNDDAKTAPAVAMPAVVNGVLSTAGDVDCFTVKLKKGETLVASLDAHRTLRAPMDAVLQILSADGTVLDQNHDARGLDPEVGYTATSEGTFAVRLFAFPSQPDSSVRHFGSPACVYRLTLTAGEFVNFVTPLAVERGKEATVALHGWNLKEISTKLGKTDELVGVANPFLITREPHPCFDSTSGSDKPLAPPFTATGRVAKAGVVSVVPFVATAGKPLAIRLDSATLGLALSPVLKVTDVAGKQLFRVEPAALGGPIDAAFSPPTTGTFRFEVRDLFNSGGSRHVYRLRVTPVVSDVEGRMTADRLTLTVGAPLDVPITVTPKGGFTGELVPFADGLPDGVTAVTAPPAAKADPNTVVLRLTAVKPVSGTARLGVTKKGEDGFRRAAVAPVPEFDRTTADIWLTAKPAEKK